MEEGIKKEKSKVHSPLRMVVRTCACVCAHQMNKYAHGLVYEKNLKKKSFFLFLCLDNSRDDAMHISAMPRRSETKETNLDIEINEEEA